MHEPTFDQDEISAALEVLASKRVTQGEKVKEFEHTFADMFGYGHAVACNSGSSANLLAISALMALGKLKPGDEVIVSALSWSTTVFPLIQHGLVPVFVDCDPHTFNMNVMAMLNALSPRTRAVMPVHVYGNPCDMDFIVQFCGLHELLLIEDGCEAMGATYGGESVGSFGIAGTFSFYFSHHVTTLEGGMVVTDDAELADMLRIQRSHGWLRDVNDDSRWPVPEGFDPRFYFVELGYNLRLTEMQAAMGLVQLTKLSSFVEKRRELLTILSERLQSGWMNLQKETPYGESSAFGTAIIGSPGLRRHAQSKGIETRPVIAGNLARHPGIAKYPHLIRGSLDVADKILHDGFAVPCHQGMTNDDAHAIADVLWDYSEVESHS